jgi:hypothetical protein
MPTSYALFRFMDNAPDRETPSFQTAARNVLFLLFAFLLRTLLILGSTRVPEV